MGDKGCGLAWGRGKLYLVKIRMAGGQLLSGISDWSLPGINVIRYQGFTDILFKNLELVSHKPTAPSGKFSPDPG